MIPNEIEWKEPVIIARDYPDHISLAFALKLFLDENKHKAYLISSNNSELPKPPEFVYSEEHECLVPFQGAFHVEFNNNYFQFEIRDEYKSARLTILCEKKNQDVALDILTEFSKYSKGPITLQEHFEDDDIPKALSFLFEKLETDFDIIDESGKYDEPVCYEFLDEAGGYVPVKGRFSVSEKDSPTVFTIRIDKTTLISEYLDIEITGSAANKKTMEDFLRSMVSNCDRKMKEDDEHVAVSLDGEVLKLSEYSRSDIGGLDEQMQKLEELVRWPLENAELLKEKGISSPKALLLYGPPGTGKTLIAKVLACESGANFLSANTSDLTSYYYGESSKLIKRLFKHARENSPIIIFLDEFDALARDRGDSHEATVSMINQLLIELDGINETEGVLLITATNRIEAIDPAIIRPGRFDAKIEIPLPDLNGRLQIINIHIKKLSLSPDVSIDEIANLTEGFSGADLRGLCNDAAYASIRRYLSSKGLTSVKVPKSEYERIIIEPEDFNNSIKKMQRESEEQNSGNGAYYIG